MLLGTIIRHYTCALQRLVFQRDVSLAEGSLYLETAEIFCSVHSCDLNSDGDLCYLFVLKLHCNFSVASGGEFEKQVVT